MSVEVLLISAADDVEQWRQNLGATLPELVLHAWPHCPDPAAIEFALAWKPRPGVLAQLPSLRLIQCLGMGVDGLFADPQLPTDVPLARLFDPDLIEQMSQYIGWAVLNFHRHFDQYRSFQDEAKWRLLPATDASTCQVGILGLGAIGTDCATKLAALGFRVAGWSRRSKTLSGIDCFSGAEGLAAMLKKTNVLVCLLPLTDQTRGIIDQSLLAQLPPGALVINAARGEHVVDLDLLAALNSGHLGGAVLDVFTDEPLRKHHPYWDHPKVRVTPHIAGVTRAESAARVVAENIRRVLRGEPPLHLVSREQRY